MLGQGCSQHPKASNGAAQQPFTSTPHDRYIQLIVRDNILNLLWVLVGALVLLVTPLLAIVALDIRILPAPLP